MTGKSNIKNGGIIGKVSEYKDFKQKYLKYLIIIINNTFFLNGYLLYGNGQDRAVSVATCYMLEGLRLKFRQGEIFGSHPDQPLNPNHPPIQAVQGLLPRCKATGAWC